MIKVSPESGSSRGAAKSDVERVDVKIEGTTGKNEKAAPPMSDVPRNFRRVIIALLVSPD